MITHAEAVDRRCSVKKVFLKISQNSQKNTCARVSFLITLQVLGTVLETLAQVFFCGFCEVFKNTFFYRAPPVTASAHATSKRVKNIKQSTISDYLLTFDCDINFDGFTNLCKDTTNFSLLINESSLNAHYNPICNKTVKSL